MRMRGSGVEVLVDRFMACSSYGELFEVLVYRMRAGDGAGKDQEPGSSREHEIARTTDGHHVRRIEGDWWEIVERHLKIRRMPA